MCVLYFKRKYFYSSLPYEFSLLASNNSPTTENWEKNRANHDEEINPRPMCYDHDSAVTRCSICRSKNSHRQVHLREPTRAQRHSFRPQLYSRHGNRQHPNPNFRLRHSTSRHRPRYQLRARPMLRRSLLSRLCIVLCRSPYYPASMLSRQRGPPLSRRMLYAVREL